MIVHGGHNRLCWWKIESRQVKGQAKMSLRFVFLGGKELHVIVIVFVAFPCVDEAASGFNELCHIWLPMIVRQRYDMDARE